jgi:hypothetical protein
VTIRVLKKVLKERKKDIEELMEEA